jgi:hypothetical protein
MRSRSANHSTKAFGETPTGRLISGNRIRLKLIAELLSWSIRYKNFTKIKIHYRVHSSPSLVQMCPIPTFTLHFHGFWCQYCYMNGLTSVVSAIHLSRLEYGTIFNNFRNLFDWSSQWGETTCLNCGHQGPTVHPRWYMNMENHGEMMSTGKTSDSFIRELSGSPTNIAIIVACQEHLGEGIDGFYLRTISCS